MIRVKLPMRIRQIQPKLFALRIFYNLKTYPHITTNGEERVSMSLYFVINFAVMLMLLRLLFLLLSSSNDLWAFVQTCNKTIKTLFCIFFSLQPWLRVLLIRKQFSVWACFYFDGIIVRLFLSHFPRSSLSLCCESKRPLWLTRFCKMNVVFGSWWHKTSTPTLQFE